MASVADRGAKVPGYKKSEFMKQVEANLVEAREDAAIKKASPDYDTLKAEFGAESMSGTREDWKLQIKRPDLLDNENQQRWDRFRALYSGKVAASRERSLRRDATSRKVAVRDTTGRYMEVPATQEARIAKKGGFRAVLSWGRRRKRYRDADLPAELPRKPLRTAAEIRGW